MRLITSADTLEFLGRSAPKPWVKRMLRWMIFDEEVTPYFKAGRIVPRATVGSILIAEGINAMAPMVERDEAIRARFNEEYSPRIVGRHFSDYAEDDPIEWDETAEPHAVGAGFFIFADRIDWEEGTLSTDIMEPELGDLRHLFWDSEEHLVSMFSKAEFAIELSGMCFRWDNVEMLQPGHDIDLVKAGPDTLAKARLGRPRKWDWEGALTHLVRLAQHPDGLPIGPSAQAKIEGLIADWFVTTTGNSPSAGHIRTWAQKVMRELNGPKA